jgi:cobaltochelatase CobS
MVMIQGYHGTGKSTHIEQVAARLNWPLIRVNLDSHVSRIDLVGKDAIVLKDGKQITEFREGILPWALQRPIALVFDEYDAGRPDVMFVIQRVLEASGQLTLLDQNRVIEAAPELPPVRDHEHGRPRRHDGPLPRHAAAQPGQMDRWRSSPRSTISRTTPRWRSSRQGSRSRQGHRLEDGPRRRHDPQRLHAGDISTVMSPRTVITWAENTPSSATSASLSA